MMRSHYYCIFWASAFLFAGEATTSWACDAGGSVTVLGLGGGDTNPHSFLNQCLAASGTSVTITIQAVADLGCNSWDAIHRPYPDQCDGCSPIGQACCDVVSGRVRS